MQGLINRAIQSFVCHTYGNECWQAVCCAAGVDAQSFAALLDDAPGRTAAVLAALSARTGRERADLLEDLGTYLVAHPSMERLRRLMRFGGETYGEFLQSLDDLAERARLAVPDLTLPELELQEDASGAYTLICGPGLPGYGEVMVGLLRAMADDYGVLALLRRSGEEDGNIRIEIRVVEANFASGRRFDLGASAG